MSGVVLTDVQQRLMALVSNGPVHMLEYLKWASENKIENRLDFIGDLVKKDLIKPENILGNGVRFRRVDMRKRK